MKHFILLLACVLSLLLFSSCSTPAKNEAALQADLANYLNEQSQTSAQVTSFQIEKRQTDTEARSDIVYALATTETDVAVYVSEYVMTYGLYNEGWLLDDVTIQSSQATPLFASAFTDSQIADTLRSFGYTGISDISVYDRETDLAAWTDTYYVTATDRHAYMTEELNLFITFTFDPTQGWSPSNASCFVYYSFETWNVAGSYSRKNVNTGYEDGQLCTIEYFENGTILWYFNDQQDYQRRFTMTNVSDMSPTEFFTDHGRMDDTDKEYHINYGYSVAIDNVDWNSITYAAPQIYLGKDHIYIMDTHERTDFDKCIHYQLEYELIPLE